MKIKNSVNSIKPDAAIIIMCVAAIVACPLRIFQMLKIMEPATGFYTDYKNVLVIALYAVLAVASALILILTYLSAKVPASIAPKGRHIISGVSALIFAAALFYDTMKTYLFGAGEHSATIVQNFNSEAVILKFQELFALLACIYLVIYAVANIVGKSFHKSLKIFSLAPLFWATAEVLGRITVIINIQRVSELLLEILSLIFVMMFFLSFARIASEVNQKGSMWSMLATGSIAGLLILTYTVPRAVLMLSGNEGSLVTGYPLSLSAAGCALFMLVTVITALRSGYTTEDAELLEQSQQEEAEDQTSITDDTMENE